MTQPPLHTAAALTLPGTWLPTYHAVPPREWTLPPAPRPAALQAELVLLDTGARAYGGALPCDLPRQPLAGLSPPALLAVHVPLAAYPADARADRALAPVLRVTVGPHLLAAVRLPPAQRVVGGRAVAWLRLPDARGEGPRPRTLALAASLQTA